MTVGVYSFLRGLRRSLFRFIDQINGRRFGAFWVIIIALTTSLFFAFPSYDLAHSEEMRENWNAILYQTHHPFTPTQYDGSTHQANLAFRVTPVLLGRLFSMSSIEDYLVLQFVCWIGLVTSFFFAFQKLFGDKVVATLLTWAIALTFIGNVLCSDYRGFFDVVAYLFLTLAILTNRVILLFVFLLLAYFTDERALICSGIIMAYYSFQNTQIAGQIELKKLLVFNRYTNTVWISWLTYISLRVTLSAVMGLRSNTQVMIDYLVTESIHQVNLLPFGLWTGLEGFWLLVAAAAFALWCRKTWRGLVISATAFFVVAFVGIWVFDITRSMAYLLPGIFLSSLIVAKELHVSVIRNLAFLILITSFFPTYYAGGQNAINWLYPAPLQLLRLLIQ